MTTSYLEIARSNRVIALETLRRKRSNALNANNDVVCLQGVRAKHRVQPIFSTTRVHRFEERLAA